MLQIPLNNEIEPLEVSDEQRLRLGRWLQQEVEDALSSRFHLENVWREALRQYDAVPKNPTKNTPVPDAPNIEVPLGALAVDSLYSQVLDLVFSVKPTVTVRSTNREESNVDKAKAVQRFVNRVVTADANLRAASEETFLDNIQLGTGVFYVPWVSDVVKRERVVVKSEGPIIYYHPVEDLIVPITTMSDIQRAPWVGLRFWLTQNEIDERAMMNTSWNIEGIAPTGSMDWVRSRRELLGHTIGDSGRKAKLFELIDIYCYFDIDEDGWREDLYVVWDRTSSRVVSVQYNPLEKRPIEVSRYQRRAGLPYGIGVMEMNRAFQEETTMIHNERVLNMQIANTRLWKARTGSVPENMMIWPNKIVEMDNPDDLQPEQLGDIYTSSPQAEMLTINLAERRVGVSSAMQQPSSVLGSRTPGITALSFLQQQNKRFTAAFDGMRESGANAVIQCLQRYHEQIQLEPGGGPIHAHITKIMGPADGRLVVQALEQPDFEQYVEVELTASSASINREADRQNAMLLVQILAQYYERTLELVALSVNPEVPPEVKETAKRIASVVGEIIERTIQTFDQVRDPQTFIINVEEEVNGRLEDLPQGGVPGLADLLGLFGQPGTESPEGIGIP